MTDFEGVGIVTKRRYLTVLFSDLSSSSELAESMEAEDLSAILDQIRQIAREVIRHHGGRVARIQGDGLLAVFGYPNAMEDDGRRACEAALDLHKAVCLLAAPSLANPLALNMHSGIHAGLVLLTEGDIERGRFDLVGEVPNTAARLCDAALAGEICVSSETLGPQSHFFQHSEPKKLELKGRGAPLTMTYVIGRSSIYRRFDAAAAGGLGLFVGRKDTLSTLHSLLRRTMNGEQSALVVIGEPGIGKTRLLAEFQRQIDPQNIDVLHGYCESYLNAEPMQPFLQIVRGALGWKIGISNKEFADNANSNLLRLGSEWPEVMAPLVHTMLVKLEGAANSTGIGNYPKLILQLIGALAKKRPLLLVLDDWQWADDASRHTLDALLSLQLPLMVVMAARPFGTSDDVAIGVPVLHLPPFVELESAGAIMALLPNADPFSLQEIQIQAGGSPLYIEELCHSIAAGGTLHTTERKSGRAAWINALVASRVSRLPEDEAALLQFASVIGNAFPCWLLELLTGYGENSPMVAALTAHDFLFPASQAGMLRFKHALTRDAVYNTVDPQRRRSIHLKVAESLRDVQDQGSANDRVEALAYHCDAAGLSVEAARYGEISGDRAMSAMALDSARAHYVTALEALEKFPTLERVQKVQWCTLAQKLGMACVFDPLDLPNGMALFERAGQIASHVGDSNLIARAEYWLGYMTYAKGLLRNAQKHCDKALAFAMETNDTRLAVQVKATLGQIWVSAGNYERALPLMDEAVEVKKENSRPGSRVAIGSAYTLARKAYMLGDQGKFELAHECFKESLDLVANVIHPIGASIWELVSAVYIWQGRWIEAISAARTGADVALRCRTRSMTAMGRALGASAQWAMTKDDTAFNTLREATQWIEDRGGAISNSLNYGWLVHASVDRGEVAMARHYAARLLQQSRSLDRHGEALGRRALGRMALANGDNATAQRHLEKAVSIATLRGAEHEYPSNLLSQADLAIYGNRHSEACFLIDDACTRFERLSMAWHLEEAKKRRASIQLF